MKKLVMSLLVLFVVSTMLSLTSCKKYDDGPAVSLVPRKERVANTWVIGKAYADDEDVTEDYDNYEIYFTAGGDAELTAEYTVFGTDYTVDTDGTWEFRNNQSNIYVDFEDDSQDAEYQILRLTEKELWLRKVGEDLELHLKEK